MGLSFSQQLDLAAKAHASIIQIISHDTLRIDAECRRLSEVLNAVLITWNQVDGVRFIERKKDEYVEKHISDINFSSLIEWFSQSNPQTLEDLPKIDQSKKYVLWAEDTYPFLTPNNTNIIRLKNYCLKNNMKVFKNRTLIFSQSMEFLPIELIKETQVFHLPYPNREEIKILAQLVKEQYHLDDDYIIPDDLIEAALGLSTSEISLAFAKVAVEKKRLTQKEIPLIVAEKAQVIKKAGLLEYFQPSNSLDDLGGLDRLKDWLDRRKLAFSSSARNYGLEPPRGALMLGLPGTGKSMTAKAVSQSWNLPLLRLDMGKVFGGILGQSEENMRNALQVAETIAPCILWIDEIEKAMSGSQSSSQTDGGTTSRVLGSFLTWMQEKTAPVFVLATANRIDMLPPELLRKGRLDEIFFVDLPTFKERIEIFRIHLQKRKNRDRLFKKEDLENFSKLTQGFTGAEIEEVIKEALFNAFNDHVEPTIAHLEKAITSTSPLSVTMSEMIESTRNWANGRAVKASSEPYENLRDKNYSIVKLKQESYNPFIKTKPIEDQPTEK